MTRLSISVLCLFMTLMFGACFQEEMPESIENIKVGDHVPEIALALHDGTVFDNSHFIDKTTLLVFFSTTCGDCRYEMPEVQRFYASLPEDTDIQVIGISRGQSEAEVAAYWKEMNLTFPYSAQNDRHIYELFASQGVPRIYIIDGDGIVVAAFDDKNKPAASELTATIRDLQKK